MSRRESRVSINIRQNDALLEFENFKKRFLLANKHITKLNSTLSVKIDELNAHISALNVENLRLRSTEIALCAQLRREKDKSRSIMADAETAVMALMSQLGSLRESHKVPTGKRNPKSSPVQTIRSRPQSNNPPPALPRIARPPGFPEIAEEDEVEADPPTLSARRRSSSRLPIPARSTALAVPVEVEEPQPKQKKKSVSRRQSGLIASGKPTEAPLSPPPEPAVVQNPVPLVEDDIFPVLNEQEEELEAELEVPKKRKRSKRREREEDNVLLVLEGTTSRLRDVTNSPQKTNFLPPLDTIDVDRHGDRDSASEIPTSATSLRTNSTRAFLSTAPTTPCPSTPATGYLPSPRVSSSPPPEVDTTAKEPDPASNVTSRTGRVRKSVNYAEPKLNTKMRKPDPPPGPNPTPTLKRASGSVREREDSPPESRPPSSSSSNPSEPSSATRKVKRKAVSPLPDDPEVLDVASDDDDGMQADAEFGGLRGDTPWVSTSEKRRRSAMVAKSRGSIEEARRHSTAS